MILLADEVVAHMREKVVLPGEHELEIIDRRKPSMPPDWYTPYKTDGSLIPCLADLGDGYRYHTTGLVHDERGFPTRGPTRWGRSLTGFSPRSAVISGIWR